MTVDDSFKQDPINNVQKEGSSEEKDFKDSLEKELKKEELSTDSPLSIEDADSAALGSDSESEDGAGADASSAKRSAPLGSLKSQGFSLKSAISSLKSLGASFFSRLQAKKDSQVRTTAELSSSAELQSKTDKDFDLSLSKAQTESLRSETETEQQLVKALMNQLHLNPDQPDLFITTLNELMQIHLDELSLSQQRAIRDFVNQEVSLKLQGLEDEKFSTKKVHKIESILSQFNKDLEGYLNHKSSQTDASTKMADLEEKVGQLEEGKQSLEENLGQTVTKEQSLKENLSRISDEIERIQDKNPGSDPDPDK